MRHLIVGCLLAGAVCGLPSVAQAQVRAKIDQIRIGWPAGDAPETRYKTGSWTPVFVDIMTGKNFPKGEVVIMEVETTDSDNIGNRYVTVVRGLEEEQTVREMTYVRPGNMGSEVSVTLRDRSGNELDRKKPLRTSQNALTADTILYFLAGSPPYKFRRAIYGQGRDANDRDEDIVDLGLRKFAYADKVEQLPNRWFGYQSVDVFVLTTGKVNFIQDLVNEQNQCKAALAEWVRRGGKLVISVGENYQAVKDLLAGIEKRTGVKLIDCDIQGPPEERRQLLLQGWVQGGGEQLPGPPLKVALLKPGKNVDVLVKEKDFSKDKSEDRPMIIQAPCGLGRVMLVAFDIDQAPFTQWSGQTNFYKKLQRELEPRESFQQGGDGNVQRFQEEQNPYEIASSLQHNLETFDDIPVVSFGWVALFIFLYILIVGPLDYIFLKKVVKRLELTWVTFPVVVIVVSTLAYFTAYYLKGNDLKINKVDVVDIDLHNSRTYGSTWFTLFSPRIQNYTVGIEPASPSWVAPLSENYPSYSTMVGWMGRPEDRYGGTGSSGGGLFKRAYNYDSPEAACLEGVPIQVWATKSFSATWEAPFPTGRPLFTANLTHPPGNPSILSGTITSNLPERLKLQDIVLIHGDNVYSIPSLEPGREQRVNVLNKTQLRPWIQESMHDPYHQVQGANRPHRGRDFGETTHQLGPLLKQAFFFRKYTQQSGMDNANLRYLDQSWRLDRKGEQTDRDARADARVEAILIARAVPTAEDLAEDVTKDDVSPTRLWLGQVPGPGKERPSIPGKMLQRTFVRVFIPVTTK